MFSNFSFIIKFWRIDLHGKQSQGHPLNQRQHRCIDIAASWSLSVHIHPGSSGETCVVWAWFEDDAASEAVALHGHGMEEEICRQQKRSDTLLSLLLFFLLLRSSGSWGLLALPHWLSLVPSHSSVSFLYAYSTLYFYFAGFGYLSKFVISLSHLLL